MTLNEKNFVITLTEEEITLLHKAANEMKLWYEQKTMSDDIDERIEGNKYVSAYRHLRDDLAELVGTRYGG